MWRKKEEDEGREDGHYIIFVGTIQRIKAPLGDD